MAEGCQKVTSGTNADISSGKCDLNVIYFKKYHQHLVYDRNRVMWTGSLELLKEFIKDLTRESGRWLSPGGTSKRFISLNSDLSITWYHNKQKTLLFQGKYGDKLKSQLIEICVKKALNENMADHGTNPASSQRREGVIESTSYAVSQPNDKVMLSVNQATYNCTYGCMQEDIENMKLDMEILRSRVDALQSLPNANEVCPSVELYINKIHQLEQLILDEKKKTNQLEVELASIL